MQPRSKSVQRGYTVVDFAQITKSGTSGNILILVKFLPSVLGTLGAMSGVVTINPCDNGIYGHTSNFDF
jgi:hypothetical protein